ncbi:GntR family transcriptional regulator [Rhizobium sp. BK376]|uniref:GntR family transcriptional regulator n=1 Tax=Rhizobium sp. BK376 TaxID=2512149 RepID=UPI001054103B|nr:GntR family transcriptional regulator [Rhizobium sp. BK376]TCR79587.1 GntR family transcriptional regulator [Rhizobium sp. BK376]
MSDTSNFPLYYIVETALAGEITNGFLKPGDQLPTEENLMRRFGVSRTTVRKAIEALVNRSVVEIRRGKGTYVTQPKIRQELTELSGFVEDMLAVGRNPTARLISSEAVTADSTVAERLEVPTGTRVYRIERIRLADGVPVSFDETYLPLEIGEKIASNDLEAEPIFSLLEAKYDIPLIEAEYQLEATTADARSAEALGIEAGAPIFLIERTSFCAGPTPIDYERLYYRGDLVRFVTRLSRRPRERS